MSSDDFHTVAIRQQTWEFAEATKPEWMPMSRFVDGVVWAYYGSEMEGRPLTTREHDAVHRLCEAGVHRSIVADAFGVTRGYLENLQSVERDDAE